MFGKESVILSLEDAKIIYGIVSAALCLDGFNVSTNTIRGIIGDRKVEAISNLKKGIDNPV